MKTLAVRLALAVLGVSLAAGTVGCGSPDTGTNDTAAAEGQNGLGSAGSGQPSPELTGSTGADGSANGSADGGSGTDTGGDGDTGGNGGPSGGGQTGGGAEQQTGPTVVSFAVTGKPSCPAGTNLAPIEGNPVTLSWKVTGEPVVTLSVDGPGAYQTYNGQQGTETLAFPCGGQPGSYQKHTYTLTVERDGVKRSKTLTVQAKINEIPVVD